MVDERTLATLLDLERRGWDALCDGTGDRFYAQTMTDDAVMVLANGMVLDRGAVVAALSQAPPWRRYEIADERLVPITADVAAVVYTGSGWRDSERPEFVGAMTSVYVRAGGTWRLAVYQQTVKPDGS